MFLCSVRILNCYRVSLKTQDVDSSLETQMTCVDNYEQNKIPYVHEFLRKKKQMFYVPMVG